MFRTLFVLPAVLCLAACQTTGTNYAVIPNGLTPADSNMSCEQMQAEFMQLDQIIAASGGAQANNQMTNAGVNAAKQSAYYANDYKNYGVLNSIASFASSMNSATIQQQRQQAQAAQNRRYQLLNLAKEKGCM